MAGSGNRQQEEFPNSDSNAPSSQQSLQQQQQQQPVVRRRTVECAMAWELDCVASGMLFCLLSLKLPPLEDDNANTWDDPHLLIKV